MIQVQFNLKEQQEAALAQLDQAIVAALNSAVAFGVPQGLLVAVLQGHLWRETQRMCEDGGD